MKKGKPYSQDLRERVIAAYQAGESTMREVAARFSVSCTWVNELVQRQKKTGSFAAKPYGGGAEAKLTSKHYPVLEEIINAQNDLTLAEISQKLAEKTGIKVSQSTICRALQKMKLTRKKKTFHADKQKSEEVKQLRLEYQLIMWAIETNNLVFIDESGANLNMAITYARSTKGRRAHGPKPHNKGKNLNIIAAIAITGVIAALSFFGSNDTLSFLFYVTDVLVPQLNRDMVVVMDNLNLHTTDEVRKAIEDTGAKLVFLPTYSPDLSPIEMFWSKVKSILRSISPRTTEQLHSAITVAFNSVSTSNLFGWFYECDARTVLI